MIPIVEERVGDLQQLCIRYRVLRLDLFGSAATSNYHEPEGTSGSSHSPRRFY